MTSRDAALIDALEALADEVRELKRLADMPDDLMYVSHKIDDFKKCCESEVRE